MTRALVTPAAGARRLEGALRALLGLPRRPVLGPGRHAPIPAEPGPGWTIRATSTVEHPTDRRIGFLLTRDVEAALDSPRARARVDPAVLASLDAAPRIELGADWREDPGDGDGPRLRFRRVDPLEASAQPPRG